MAATPTVDLCDDLVTALLAAWVPVAPSGAERAYFKRIGDEDDSETKLEGRRVYIFPTSYSRTWADRGEHDYAHRVSVLVVERFEAAGDPDSDWIDERVDFVHQHILDGFDFPGDTGPPAFNRYLTTERAEVVVCDVEKLLTAGKLFYSLVEFEFSEVRTA